MSGLYFTHTQLSQPSLEIAWLKIVTNIVLKHNWKFNIILQILSNIAVSRG